MRLHDLLIDFERASKEGNHLKVLTQYTKPTLLLLDEWLLMKLTLLESKHIFELIHKRRKKYVDHLLLTAP